MVTLDKIVERAKPFSSKTDLEEFERARQGLEIGTEFKETFEKTLKALTGYDSRRLPKGEQTTTLKMGDVLFNIKSSTVTKRPSYKSISDGWQSYILGIYFNYEIGQRVVPNVRVHEDELYMEVNAMHDAYSIILGSHIMPTVKHVIDILVGERTQLELANCHSVPIPQSAGLANNTNAITYAKLQNIMPDLEEHVLAYSDALVKESRARKSTLAVTDEHAIEQKKSRAKGPDWKYVVTKLMRVPTEKRAQPGELDIMIEPQADLATPDFANYDFVHYKNSLSVSLRSVYDRIETLKGEEVLVRKIVTTKPIMIV